MSCGRLLAMLPLRYMPTLCDLIYWPDLIDCHLIVSRLGRVGVGVSICTLTSLCVWRTACSNLANA